MFSKLCRLSRLGCCRARRPDRDHSLDVHSRGDPELLAEHFEETAVTGAAGAVAANQFRQFALDLGVFFFDGDIFGRSDLSSNGPIFRFIIVFTNSSPEGAARNAAQAAIPQWAVRTGRLREAVDHGVPRLVPLSILRYLTG